MNATDPTGFFKLKQFAGLIAGAILTFATGGFGAALASSWYGAAFIGAVSGAVGAAANGGDILKGALFGAVSGAAFSGAGSLFDNGGMLSQIASKTLKQLTQAAVHGVVGGGLSLLQGGKFGHGFVSSGFAKFMSVGADRLQLKDFGRFMSATITGGTVSSLTGGKFANGAQTAALAFAVNEYGSRYRAAQKERVDLLEHEGVNGSHAVEKHVGKSDNYLRRRMNKASVSLKIAPGVSVDRYPSSMSTFTSLEAANALVNMTLDGNYQEIQAWLDSGGSNTLTVGAVFNGPQTGRVAYREGRVSLNAGPTRVRFGGGNAVTVVLRRNDSFTNGYNVHTAYPRIE